MNLVRKWRAQPRRLLGESELGFLDKLFGKQHPVAQRQPPPTWLPACKTAHCQQRPHNKSLDASGGGVFLNLRGAAKGALIRPVEIVRLISRGQLNRSALTGFGTSAIHEALAH